MLWVLIVLTSAMFFAAKDILSKYLLEDISSLEFSFLFSLVATITFTPMFVYFLFKNTAVILPLTVLAMAIVAASRIAGFVVRATGLKIGDISVVTPLSRMTPIFVVVSEFIVFREAFGILTLAGIPLVVLGSYIIMLKEGTSVLEPVKNLSKERAAQLAILSTMIYGFSAPASRYAVRNLSPEIFTYLSYLIMVAGFGYLLKRRDGSIDVRETFNQNSYAWLLIGVVAMLSSYLLFYSYTLVPISKANPVLQVRVLPPVIIGGLYFKEKNLARKTLGTITLLAGVVLVII